MTITFWEKSERDRRDEEYRITENLCLKRTSDVLKEAGMRQGKLPEIKGRRSILGIRHKTNVV